MYQDKGVLITNWKKQANVTLKLKSYEEVTMRKIFQAKTATMAICEFDGYIILV